MPFTFKLSQRLARMKLPLAIAAAAFAACELPVRVTDPNSPNSPVVQIVSSPDTVTLDPDQTQQFVAYGRTQAGDSVAVAVSWSASGGTITSGGLYTANSVAGNYQVTATAQVPASAAPTAPAISTTVSGSSQVKNRGPMAQVILNPLTASAVGGGRVQFAVYGIRKNGDSVAVSVAYAATGGIISGAGLYTAGQSAGTYQVTATQSGGTLASTAAVTISNVPVASVTVSPAAASLTAGATTQLTATPKDANGTALSGRVVTWATSNAAAATASANGLVTGVATGSATIIATSEGQSGTSALTVTNAPVASVTVSPAAATVTVGTTTQLTATPKDANGTALSGRAVTWATSNAAIATVSASGLVTGVAAGSATITATSEGQSGTSAITVSNVPVASVTVSPTAAGVTVGATTQLTATPKDANGTALSGRVVTWGTSNAVVATVSASGLVTGVAAGAATITATSDGQSGTAAMTVTNVPVASVTVSPTTASVTVGATSQLTATAKDANGTALSGRTVTWATSNAAVATVSASGLVTGVAAGSATITATSEGQSGTSAMTVTNVPVASVTVSPAAVSLTVGQTMQLAAVTKDANGTALSGRTVTWTTSNSTVATVSASGLVTGVAAGTATITATSEGVAGTAASTVTAPVSNPGTVTNLAVVGVTDTGATLAFTEVSDGTGLPASYDVRFGVAPISWGGSLPSVTRGTCATPLAGSAIGALRTCTVFGLQPGTTYGFQLVAFRGTLSVNAVFGGLSNIAQATTAPSSTSGGSAPQPGPTDTIIFQDGFERGDLSLWTQSPANGRYSLSTVPTRVRSGTQSLQVLFTPTNAYGLITRWFMPGYDEVYVRFSVMFEENFDESFGLHFLTMAGNNINNQGSSWGKAATVPNGTDYFYAGVDPEFINGDATLKPLHFYTYWPDMTCCYGNRFYQTSPKIPLAGGQWQQVVFHIKLNTPGLYDGSQTLWINGVKKIDVQNMRWRTTTDLRLNEIRFDDYMSQGPTTEHLWIDDVTLWRP